MTAHLTIALDEAQKAQLDMIAEFQKETAEAVVAKAVQDLIDYDKWYRAVVAEGLSSIDAGLGIPHEEIVAEARERHEARERLASRT